MFLDFGSSGCARKHSLQVSVIVTANNASLLDYACFGGIIMLNILNMSHTLTWHRSKLHSLWVIKISESGFHMQDLWNGSSVVVIIICMNALHVGDKKAQQLSSARSLTQNPGAPMKQRCSSLAQMDVVTIEPNRSSLTSSPHKCCVCVHEIVADYVLNIICPAYIFWTTGEKHKKDYPKQESFFHSFQSYFNQ